MCPRLYNPCPRRARGWIKQKPDLFSYRKRVFIDFKDKIWNS